MRTFIILLAAWLCLQESAFANDRGPDSSATVNPDDVTIVRDKWGVPHIFGKTDADVAYGLAWANSEDDFFTMQELLISSKGMSGKLLGTEGAKRDFFAHAIGIRKRVEEDFGQLSDAYVRYLEGYCQGINAFAKSHRKEIRVKSSFPVTPKDIVGSYMFGLSALCNVQGQVSDIVSGKYDKDGQPDLPYGSNAFAFNSRATTDGSTMLCINPHQPITGPFSWYEAHLCSEEGLNIHGAMFPGSVSISLGSNTHLGWAHTFNYLDLVDVFKLDMNPRNKHSYKFNGTWHNLEKRPVWLKVRLAKGVIIPVRKMTYWSIFGATLKSPDGSYYAVKFGANEKVRTGEQWYRMNKARNYTEFYNALKMQSIAMFNIVYADENDTIMFINNAIVPERNPNVDYSGVVKSNSDSTMWGSYHPVEDLVQTLNPNCGWVFNTNNTPTHATDRREWQNIDNWPKDFGFEKDLGENNRAERFLELMDEPASAHVSFDRMKQMKFDEEFPACSAFQQSLEHLFQIDPDNYPELAPLMKMINHWDKRSDKHDRGAAAWLITFQKVFSVMGFGDVALKKSVIIPDTTYLNALRWAKKQIDTYYGGVIPELGEVQRHVRADVNLPLGGFPDALAANYNKPWKDGRYKPYVADSFVQFTQWKDGKTRIETLIPFGSSNRKDSPHYTDQMKLYADQQTKTMTLDKEEVMRNAVSVYHPK